MNPVDRYLPFGLTLDTLVVYMVGLVTFLCIVVAWRALIDDDSRLARQRIIARRRDELRMAALGPKRRSTRRRALPLAALTRRWQLVQTAQADRIRMRLLRAGLRSREALAGFLVAKLVLPGLFLGVVFVLIYLVQIGLVSPRLRPLTLHMATILGFFAPDIYVSNLQTKRRQALQKALPDGLDLLVICAEAGLSLDAALNRVADEIGPSAPELSAELALTSVELNFLPDRRQALHNLGSRCDLASIRGVVNTLVQTEKYGTPLSQSLRVLSADFREERMLRAEEKAARLPATLTVPMIIFILPALFIVLIGPAMIDVFDKLIKSSG
jgi:tight adherence protein C